ncbi:MAG: NADP-dependent oxidoreductase [Myxococcales bacterium]|nr:NADP-dependent oxidoreductase [Myxococcales bacterium]
MKAMTIQHYGDVDQFELADRPAPSVPRGQVLVRVHGSSVNPVDAAIRQGLLARFIRLDMPAVLGVDVSGEVMAVGEGVERFAVGDRVYAYTGPGLGGGYGELATVPEEYLARVPERLDLVTAGSVPGVGATAYEAFTVHAPLQPGMRVFINGAAGGVGTYAIQVARAMGARVTGSCSPAKAALVERLGAQVVDYTTGEPFPGAGTYDVVLNAVREADEGMLRGLLRRGGTLVSIVGGPLDMVKAKVTNLVRATKTVPFIVSSKAACLEGISALIEDGAVEPVVEQVYPLAELADAHRRVETGRVAGKICIDVTSVWGPN